MNCIEVRESASKIQNLANLKIEEYQLDIKLNLLKVSKEVGKF